MLLRGKRKANNQPLHIEMHCEAAPALSIQTDKGLTQSRRGSRCFRKMQRPASWQAPMMATISSVPFARAFQQDPKRYTA